MALKLSSSVENDRLLVAISHAPLVQATAEEESAFDVGMADILEGRVLRAQEIQSRHLLTRREGE